MKKGAFEFYNAEDMGLFNMLKHILLLKDGFTLDDIKHNSHIENCMVQNPDTGHYEFQ